MGIGPTRSFLISAAIAVHVRATAVGRDAERKAEQNAVLAGDPKGLDYYVILL